MIYKLLCIRVICLPNLMGSSPVQSARSRFLSAFVSARVRCLSLTLSVETKRRLATAGRGTLHCSHLHTAALWSLGPNYGLGYYQTDRRLIFRLLDQTLMVLTSAGLFKKLLFLSHRCDQSSPTKRSGPEVHFYTLS